MPEMKFNDIFKDLKKKIYHPVYLLHGDEAYYIDRLTAHFEKQVLTDAEKGFNLTVLYGRDARPAEVIDLLKRYPMMANYQVVVLKEAQQMRELEDLHPYMGSPLKSTLFIIAHKDKTLNKTKKLYKAIKKHGGVILESKKLRDYQVPQWIKGYVKENALEIDDKACGLLAEYLGTDLSKIANELSKLVLSLPKGRKIGSAEIEKNIGISKDYNVFELQKALATKDMPKAQRIANYYAANINAHPMAMTLAMLYRFFEQLFFYLHFKGQGEQAVLQVLKLRSGWFLKDHKTASRFYDIPRVENVMGLLQEYDLRSKGVRNGSARHGELLRELIYRIVTI